MRNGLGIAAPLTEKYGRLAPFGATLAVAFALAPLAGGPAWAQGPAGVPAAGSPQGVPPQAAAAKQAPKPPPVRHIDLMEFQVGGNTLLPQRDIEATLYPFLGPDRTVEDVEKARAALEELFTKRGYPTVAATIPPQDGAGGVVRLEVVERPVGRLRVVGARYVAPGTIRAAAPSLAEGKVPQMGRVQSDLVLMNQLPDRTVAPSLRAGADPDTVDVDLKVEDHLPLHGSLELNNRQSQSTTRLRTVGSLSYNNLWQRGDSVSLGFQLAPQRPNDAEVGTFNYTYRIPNSRASLSGTYIQSNSNVSTGGAGTVIGKGKIGQFRLLLPFEGDENFTHSLSVGFDYKNLTEDVGLTGQQSRTPITYVPFTASYLASWSGSGQSTDLSGAVVWAFRGLGSDDLQFDNKRYQARPNFAYLKADFAHTHTLPYNIEVYAHAQTEVSPTPLVSSEQLSLGGMDTVRGYLEAESLGDYGGSAQLELRSPPLGHYIGGPVSTLRVFAFADGGAAAIHAPQLDQVKSNTLASVGVGAAMRLFDHIGGDIDEAHVLLPGPATHAGVNRVLFRVYGDF